MAAGCCRGEAMNCMRVFLRGGRGDGTAAAYAATVLSFPLFWCTIRAVVLVASRLPHLQHTTVTAAVAGISWPARPVAHRGHCRRTCQLQCGVVHLLWHWCVVGLEVVHIEGAHVDKGAQAAHLTGQLQQLLSTAEVGPVGVYMWDDGGAGKGQQAKGNRRCSLAREELSQCVTRSCHCPHKCVHRVGTSKAFEKAVTLCSRANMVVFTRC
jgi:hypothetical protein